MGRKDLTFLIIFFPYDRIIRNLQRDQQQKMNETIPPAHLVFLQTKVDHNEPLLNLRGNRDSDRLEKSEIAEAYLIIFVASKQCPGDGNKHYIYIYINNETL